jgi:tryptophan 7-halogenase
MNLGKVLIVGGGVDAWLTAAVLSRAARGLASITVAETAGPASGWLVALPALRGLHARFGLSDEAVGARPLLGLNHGQAVEPFGETGAMLEGLPFHHYWLRARSEGETAPLDAWSLAAQAAARGRFAPRSEDPRSPLSTLDYGLLLDAATYAARLKSLATQAGVTSLEGSFARIERTGPRLAAVTLDGDRRLEADLYIDATGADARLAGEDPWIDWSAWLPTGARLTGVEGAVARFGHDAPLAAGRRERAVVLNLVAVGGAAGAIGAADGGDLHLLQTAVSRLVALYPNTPAAVAEFNRLTALAQERARDMAILRWGVLDAPPPELAWKLAQFESRGRVVSYDEETWPEQSWTHAFLARGVTPKRWDPLAERVPLGPMRDMLGRMKAVIERTAEAMPRA